MSPYYADGWVTLYLGDCLEVTEWLAADVLVTDPPYGVAYQSNMNRDRRNAKAGRLIASDGDTSTRDGALRFWGDRPALVFGKWTAERPARVRARLIWDKTPCGFMGDLSLPWGAADEEIYVLGKGFLGKREANILRCPMLMSGDSSRPNHPTPKPLALMETLITKCPPGVVADPFTGSGSTLVAAKALGRKAIGVEIDEHYCEIAARRLSQDAFDFGEVVTQCRSGRG
jgi:site-specific DNA-methyltransferase (adenine-specific)